MSVTKRPNGRWLARVKSHGLYVGSKVLDTRAAAQAWETRQLALLSGGIDLAAGKLPLSSWITDYVADREGKVAQATHATDRFMLAQVPDHVRALPVSKITAGTIEDLLSREAGKGRAKESLRRYRATLSGMFAWLIRQKVTDQNPAKGIPLPAARAQREMRPFTAAELMLAYGKWSALDQEMADVALFLARTGLRWSEAVELRVKDFQRLPDPVLVISRAKPKNFDVKDTKNHKARQVWLENSMLAYVLQRVAGRDAEDLLLPALRRTNFVSRLNYAETSGGRTIHELRHTAATQWIARGLKIETVSEWLGHANSGITSRIYVHWLGADKNREAVAILNGEGSGHTTGTSSDQQTVG